MAYEILSKMPVPSQLPHELGVGLSKWTASKRTQFWLLANLLQNHYQWQSKSTPIKLKPIVAVVLKCPLQFQVLGCLVGFFQAGSAMVSGVWKGNLGSISLCCLSQSVWSRINFLHRAKCLAKGRHTETLELLFSCFGNIALICGLQNCWIGGVWNLFILENKIKEK